MKHVVMYIRTGVDSQADIDLQRTECESFCQMNSMDVVTILADVVDTNISRHWPSLRKLRQLICSGQIEAIVVHELSRLAPTEDELANFVREVGERGVNVYSAFESLASDTITPLRAEAVIRERERWARILYRIEQARLQSCIV